MSVKTAATSHRASQTIAWCPGQNIRDREAANFCEDFKPLIPSIAPLADDRARRILGEPERKKDFKSLFKDEDQDNLP